MKLLAGHFSALYLWITSQNRTGILLYTLVPVVTCKVCSRAVTKVVNAQACWSDKLPPRCFAGHRLLLSIRVIFPFSPSWTKEKWSNYWQLWISPRFLWCVELATSLFETFLVPLTENNKFYGAPNFLLFLKLNFYWDYFVECTCSKTPAIMNTWLYEILLNLKITRSRIDLHRCNALETR